MCPETAKNKDIRLYECVHFPLEWKLKKVLMSSVSAVDTMIFEHNRLWWLFTNIDPTNSGDHSSELFIFHSDSPLSDTWHPHAKNPVLVDSTKARNAGLLVDEGSVYRVSQRPSFGRYGSGAAINKILVLDEKEYVEENLVSIEPNFFRKICGTHHLHSNGKYSVFDFVERTRFNS